MRDADQTIERLMAGLRDTQPPAGMQSRIREAMEAHESASSRPLGHRLVTPWLFRPAAGKWLVCAAALTVCLIATVTLHRPWRAPAAIHSTHAQAQSERPLMVDQKAPIQPHRIASRVPARRPLRGGVSAANEAQVAGYPVAPLPLTEQEKLLLRLAHRHDPESMAMLNPDLRAAESAKAAEQFRRFFGIDAEEMRKENE